MNSTNFDSQCWFTDKGKRILPTQIGVYLFLKKVQNKNLLAPRTTKVLPFTKELQSNFPNNPFFGGVFPSTHTHPVIGGKWGKHRECLPFRGKNSGRSGHVLIRATFPDDVFPFLCVCVCVLVFVNLASTHLPSRIGVLFSRPGTSIQIDLPWQQVYLTEIGPWTRFPNHETKIVWVVVLHTLTHILFGFLPSFYEIYAFGLKSISFQKSICCELCTAIWNSKTSHTGEPYPWNETGNKISLTIDTNALWRSTELDFRRWWSLVETVSLVDSFFLRTWSQ